MEPEQDGSSNLPASTILNSCNSMMKNININKEDLIAIQKIIANFKKTKSDKEKFYHLCFCILVPQAKFSSAKKAVELLQSKFFFENGLSFEELTPITKNVRFINRKAEYLLELQKNKSDILSIVNSIDLDSYSKRYALKNRVKGIGMKEASHFLRNMGYTGLAIIDKHILNFIEEKSPSSDKKYLLLEEKFKNLAVQIGYDVTTLDCYIWKKESDTDYSEYTY